MYTKVFIKHMSWRGSNHLQQGGLLIRFVVVLFTLLDVCVGLGVRVGGYKIDLTNEDTNCHTRSIFHSTNVCTHDVWWTNETCQWL